LPYAAEKPTVLHLLLVLVTSACGAGTAVAPAGPRGAINPAWRYDDSVKVATGRSAMVAAGNIIASDVGREVLRRGGNAVDAAVAVSFAMAVVDPEAGNIGGGGFMMIRLKDGSVHFLDYREQAPARSTRDMFLDSLGQKTDLSQNGYLASATPGSVLGLFEAHARFGRLPFRELVEPAVKLAQNGFVVDDKRSRSIRGDSARLASVPASAAIFLPGGRVPQPGETLVQRDLARTLAAIRDQGADGFYRGWVADSLVAGMQRGGGHISHEDLERYRVIWRAPVALTYRGYTIYGAPPVSSGGLTMGMIFNVLAGWPRLPPFGSAKLLHLEAESMRRAYVLRNSTIADPAFVAVPVERLLSMQLADSLRGTINLARATPTIAPDEVAGRGSTTQCSVVDADGNAVSTTTTINDLFGSGVTVSGAGFLLNDIMDDFTTAPGRPNSWGLIQGEVNAIAPYKRPLSSMSPTIVLDPKGRLLLVLGSRGGASIITQVYHVVANVIDHHMSLGDAVSAPRAHHQALPDTLRIDLDGFMPAVLDSLRAMGHHLRIAGAGGDVEAIMRVGSEWHGVSDPRSGGGSVGY
jgi:gamma-glutamyltranspeptidase/glutathione hydrolase